MKIFFDFCQAFSANRYGSPARHQWSPHRAHLWDHLLSIKKFFWTFLETYGMGSFAYYGAIDRFISSLALYFFCWNGPSLR